MDTASQKIREALAPLGWSTVAHNGYVLGHDADPTAVTDVVIGDSARVEIDLWDCVLTEGFQVRIVGLVDDRETEWVTFEQPRLFGWTCLTGDWAWLAPAAAVLVDGMRGWSDELDDLTCDALIATLTGTEVAA